MTGCLISYFVIGMTVCVSVTTLGSIAVERYLAVVKTVTLQAQTLRIWNAVIWISAALYGSLPILSGTYPESLRVDVTCWGCVNKWYGRDDASPLFSVFALSVFGACTTVIVYCHWHVYRAFIEIMAKKKQSPSYIRHERRVFLMCLLLTLTFVFSWTLTSSCILFEFISGVPAPMMLATLSTALGGLGCTTNSIILFYFDFQIRRNVLDFLRVEKRQVSVSTPQLETTSTVVKS
jgi:hypothetical protein